jgi:hypothetical protein
MPTESSAVSNLIHQLQTRRLQTDPSTASLFQPAPSARAPRVQAMRPPAPSSRWFEHTPATIKKPKPRTRRRNPTWMLIIATLIAGAIGIGGAAYFPFDSPDDASAAFVVPTIVPAAPAPAPIVMPLNTPDPAPTIAAAPAETAPAEAAPAEPPPAETTPAPALAPEPAKPHKRTHAKKKHAIAKHVKASKPAAAAEPAEEAPAPPPPPVHHGPTVQSGDNENPL